MEWYQIAFYVPWLFAAICLPLFLVTAVLAYIYEGFKESNIAQQIARILYWTGIVGLIGIIIMGVVISKWY